MIGVDDPRVLAAVAAAQLAADRTGAVGFTEARIAVLTCLSFQTARRLLDEAVGRGWLQQQATVPARWQLTDAGRQRLAGVELAAAHRPVRRRTRTGVR